MNSKRKAYRVSSRRGRGGLVIDGNEEGEEDWDSEDEVEGLDKRLARLLREAQEVQSELERRKPESHEADEEPDERPGSAHEADSISFKLQELNAALEKIRNSQTDAGTAHARLAKQLAKPLPEQKDIPTPSESRGAEPTTSNREANDAGAMSKVALLDSRLASLERALGVSSLDNLEMAANGQNDFSPVLPTLALLDRQVHLLSSVPSQPHLDAIVQKLQEGQSSLQDVSKDGDGTGPTSNLTLEDMAKLRSLYAILPTLTSLAPTLPPLLTRLRSLRTLHTNAAAASQTLDEVERRQDEADREIKEWVEGLAKATEAVKGAEEGMRENVASIDTWIKDLDERVKRLV